jgi:hypothetical protein
MARKEKRLLHYNGLILIAKPYWSRSRTAQERPLMGCQLNRSTQHRR